MLTVHPIPPLYDASSRVLILGTMPSPKSREAHFFYAHPQNRFWRVLAAVFGEPVPESVPERSLFILSHRLALWDVLHSCEISGASDSSIKRATIRDNTRFFISFPPRFLCGFMFMSPWQQLRAIGPACNKYNREKDHATHDLDRANGHSHHDKAVV